MSFVAAPPADPPAQVADAIAGDGWYPDLSIKAFRESQRIPETVSAQRCREALLGGFVAAAIGLQRWRTDQEAAGKDGLEATSAITIGGESRALVLWRRAVHAFAAADLAETHTDISATDGGREVSGGRERNLLRADPCGALRRDATVALRDLMGKTRSRVSLR